MPVITFSTTREAGDTNSITFGSTGYTISHPPSNHSYNFSPGTYNLTTAGSGPGSQALRKNSDKQIALDDRQGAGPDNDYTDIILTITGSSKAIFPSAYTFLVWDDPEINVFYADPNPQYSGPTGIPKYDTKFVISTTNNDGGVVLTSSTGQSWDVSGLSTFTVTDLPQSSVEGLNSPAQRSYTLTVTNINGDVTNDTITVDVYNDNSPSTTWTTTFNDLEPSQEQWLELGILSGTDMKVSVSSPSSGVFFATSVNGVVSNPQIFQAGLSVYARVTSLPFNTDLTGISSTDEFGNTNIGTFDVNIGSISFSVDYITRAPKIRENFDYPDIVNLYPHPDIDLINNATQSHQLTTSETISDLEIDLPVRVSKPDAQVVVNGNTPQDTTDITWP